MLGFCHGSPGHHAAMQPAKLPLHHSSAPQGQETPCKSMTTAHECWNGDFGAGRCTLACMISPNSLLFSTCREWQSKKDSEFGAPAAAQRVALPWQMTGQTFGGNKWLHTPKSSNLTFRQADSTPKHHRRNTRIARQANALWQSRYCSSVKSHSYSSNMG